MGRQSSNTDDLRLSVLATWILCLLSAGVTLWLGIAVGGSFAGWVFEHCNAFGVLDWFPNEIIGVVVYVPMIAPGILLFWLGTKLLAIFGLRPYESAHDSQSNQTLGEMNETK